MTWQGFGSPLTVTQQALQKRRKSEMTVDQLHDFLDACKTMEEWTTVAVVRRAWTKHRQDTEAEIAKRLRKAAPLR